MFAATFPPLKESISLLDDAGWALGETGFIDEIGRLAWLIVGRKGAARICASALSCDEAWWRACEQARELGMLGQANGDTSVIPAQSAARSHPFQGSQCENH